MKEGVYKHEKGVYMYQRGVYVYLFPFGMRQ